MGIAASSGVPIAIKGLYTSIGMLEGKGGVHGQGSGVARPDTAFT